MGKVNFQDKFSKFSELWTPKVIAEMNDYQFKLAKVQGEFVWHNHSDTDEVFIVIEGCLKIEFADETIELNARSFEERNLCIVQIEFRFGFPL